MIGRGMSTAHDAHVGVTSEGNGGGTSCEAS